MANYTPFYQQGVYVCEVLQQALSESTKGTPVFLLKFQVLGAPVAGSDNYEPVRQSYERTMYLYITEKTMEFFSEKMRTLGFGGDSLGQLDPESPNHVSFVGNQFDAYCKHEPGQKGGMREVWDVSRGSSALDVVPVAAKKLRQLDQLFGRAVGKQAPGRTAKGAGSTPPAAPPAVYSDDTEITDDDIPF